MLNYLAGLTAGDGYITIDKYEEVELGSLTHQGGF
jgi:hypothetical protein